ncbi:uncharacterized protein EV420DRAFT_585953 [Desarmillaria tabescens]|uniref:Uncharacterized protein n=1 Tax=Armillaria tabescens TaxID=1929756 RepID=A0AA39K621_ARMTA|nr:uncharacterized protein EV420DRAFT_585953 [Desarmillaria tabescens]KAK0455170.1 hypothetical protein EV420DRAFT_585953 [Desarmillaria tabescens]
MASDEVFCRQPYYPNMVRMRESLLERCLQVDEEHPDVEKPMPGMERKVERLLRFSCYPFDHFIIAGDTDSFELTAAIHSTPFLRFITRPRPAVLTSPAAFFTEIVCCHHSLKLPPLCWSRLIMMAKEDGAFTPLDPDHNNHANTFPLHLCSAVLSSFSMLLWHSKHDFRSPLTLAFSDALPYLPYAIYNNVLTMLSEYVEDIPLYDSSLRKPWRALMVATVKFLLHRLSLPESDLSHTTILDSLTAAVNAVWSPDFMSEEATAITTVLESILFACVTLERDQRNVDSPWNKLFYKTIEAYQYSLSFSPSACPLRGLQVMVDFMTINWKCPRHHYCKTDTACHVLANLLENRVPAAYAVFHESRCLDFFGSHAFHDSSVRVISEYIAGIAAMLHGLVGIMDMDILQQHVDRLFEPCHLFTACLILAAHSANDIITLLAQLRPHDVA